MVSLKIWSFRFSCSLRTERGFTSEPTEANLSSFPLIPWAHVDSGHSVQTPSHHNNLMKQGAIYMFKVSHWFRALESIAECLVVTHEESLTSFPACCCLLCWEWNAEPSTGQTSYLPVIPIPSPSIPGFISPISDSLCFREAGRGCQSPLLETFLCVFFKLH